MKAPFPYFGGKSMVAAKVWAALGNVSNYIEPFFGSGAVLLSRPKPYKNNEIICDKDGFIANVWRSLQADPDEVAKWCDWPVNHADLCARRRRLLEEEESLLESLISDDEFCNPKLAGYWIWAASCWIGSGLTRPNAIPDISKRSKGVHATGKRPDIAHTGRGVAGIGQIPMISGMHALHGRNIKSSHIYEWFAELSARLRRVKVVCGDWSRVCGGNWQDAMGTVGMFFDPPYGVDDRDKAIYRHDSIDVAGEVREWCLARGEKKTYRLILAGYYEEHESLLSHGWTVERWKANGGFGNQSDGQGKVNRSREALFYSPNCISKNETLF